MELSNSVLNGYVTGMNQYSSAAGASKIQSKAGGINSDSTYEEIEDASKQFEAYMLETVIKEFKKSLDAMKEDSGDASVSQMTDVFMDQTIQSIAETMVSQYGQRLTKELTDQMARSVGVEIPDEKKAAEESAAENTEEPIENIDITES